MKKLKLQKGSSLYLTVMFMAMILTISVGVSSLVISGSGLVKGMGDAVRAFHIADSGIEETLYVINSADNQTVTINDIKINGLNFSNNFSTDYAEDIECYISITETTRLHINAHGVFNGSSRVEKASF